MGDEGLQVFNAGRISTKMVEFIPWSEQGFEDKLRIILIKKCRRNPVVILNDMVEQHYRKERVPNVSFADRQNIIRNRLNVAFPNYRVRAALKLDKKLNPSEGGKKETPYLFAAVAKSEAFNKTVNSVFAAGSSIVGFYLLPVEGTALVNDLSKKLNKGNKVQSAWTIFLGQQHSGGLRQIVIKNGELALTRMSPIVNTDVEPGLWAQEVSQELTATMSYLTRFGYKKEDGLDIFIVANPEAGEILQNAVDIEADVRVLTATDVSKYVGAGIGKQADERYTDAVYASYLGKRKKFLLPMEATQIDEYTKPKKVASFIIIGLLLGASYMGYGAFQNWKQSLELNDNIALTKQQIRTQEQEYERQLEKTKGMGFDFLVVDSALKNYEALKKTKVNMLPVLQEIGRSLGADLTLDRIDVSKKQPTGGGNRFSYQSSDEDASGDPLNAVIFLSFPSTIVPEVGVRQIENLRDRLAENLQGYDVEIIKQVADLSYTGNVVGGTDEEGQLEDFTAEIEITERRS
ncbi:MAG: hypothetical protein AAF988_06280 [Pseudomonadota bacterium]